MTDKQTTGPDTPETDAMQRIVFEGCEFIVIAPEDMEQMERSRNALRAENERQEARIKELEATLTEALDMAESLVESMDYLGTGSDSRWADKQQKEDADKVAAFRKRLSATPPTEEKGKE